MGSALTESGVKVSLDFGRFGVICGLSRKRVISTQISRGGHIAHGAGR